MVLLRRSVRKTHFIMTNIKNSQWTEPLSLALKLRVKTLPFKPKLEQLKFVCGYQTLWGISLLCQVLWY